MEREETRNKREENYWLYIINGKGRREIDKKRYVGVRRHDSGQETEKRDREKKKE